MFSKAVSSFYIPPLVFERSSFSKSSQILQLVFTILAILMDVKRYIVDLTKISVVTNNPEHLFLTLLTTCILYSKICLFSPVPIFLVGWLVCFETGIWLSCPGRPQICSPSLASQVSGIIGMLYHT